ncbi:Wadjet anti-phage system protein JetD domain-containing protein [Sphaerisporangium sp. NPDC051011]|uniref:Wadjet anti-phage system protein JetD domain-containing protein n=1 Tax=Sphaerisporangium sp. NPDC051011 TaxID=3155792 RepID=UPI0033FAD3A2
MLVSAAEGRAEIYLRNLPVGTRAVTVPRNGSDGPRLPLDQKKRIKPAEVDLITNSSVPAFAPPPEITRKDLVKILRNRTFRQWSSTQKQFGDRTWDIMTALVRAGGIALRCDVVNALDYEPKSWRLTQPWSDLAEDLLDELLDRQDPDDVRAELSQKMEPLPELAYERKLLLAVPRGSKLAVPPGSSAGTDCWSVYDAAVSAASVWWSYTSLGKRLSAKELAAKALRGSKRWTPARMQAFANIIDLSFDEAVDKTDTEVRLRGPLVWSIGDVVADASKAKPWISLPANGLLSLGVVKCEAVGIFVIENSDTFERICMRTALSDTWLLIWSKGYSSTGTVELLRSFSELPLTTWCDLDAHGIQIISNLTGRVGRFIRPVAMEPELFESGVKYHQEPDDQKDNHKLAERMAKTAIAELRPLAEAIVQAEGAGCEQESLSPEILPLLPTLLDGM